MKHLESLYSPQEFKETWNNIKQSRRLKQTIIILNQSIILIFQLYSFFPNTIRDWNSLPLNVVKAQSINSFLAQLDLF